jgi:insertion element IS1 protein InsB
VRDTARSLHISPTTVLSELKKKAEVLEAVNTAVLRTLNPEKVTGDIAQAGEAEMDEMWSFVGHKGHPRWLWHAIDHHTGKIWASVFGRRQDTVFLQLQALLEPLGITPYYTTTRLKARMSSGSVFQGLRVTHSVACGIVLCA